MNTFVNFAGTAALFALVLLPALIGLARERRIDRELREGEREREGEGQSGILTEPFTRGPHLRSWVRAS